jgi:PKD repeat protein
MGCDEWNPVPLLVLQPTFLAGAPSRRCLTFDVVAAGLPPFSYFWYKDGGLIQENGHFSNTSASNLLINCFQPEDSGSYQLVVSNAYGMVTGQVAQVTIHTVDIANANPVPPYSTWQTAATNIQDAIDAAVDGDIVLVTNGLFSTGGKVISGDLTNRVALDKALTVISVNGYSVTVIEGAWDPVSTNGPAAVRCAILGAGARLNGFTLRNGATRSSFDPTLGNGGGALMIGRSVYSSLISNCMLTNNRAQFMGGGAAQGTLYNCFLSDNTAQFVGGAYNCKLNNCTVRENHCFTTGTAGGVDSSFCSNCIITDNYQSLPGIPDYKLLNYPQIFEGYFTNCCTSPLPPSYRGTNNIKVDPMFLNYSGGFALSPASPCRGAGNPLFSSGYDLDDETYLNPPSIGCDEINAANTTGPLSFSFQYLVTNTLAYHRLLFTPQFEGRVSELDWSFGDGPMATNLGGFASHTWTNGGTYTVTLTAYNADHPSGVSSNLTVTVDPFLSPSLQFNGIVSNAFEFNFLAQGQGLYTVQYATNLSPPVAWQSLQGFLFSSSNTIMTIRDPAVTNAQRFYRIFGQ